MKTISFKRGCLIRDLSHNTRVSMKKFSNALKCSIFLFAVFCHFSVYSDNQTETLSPIYGQDELPFQISIEYAGFSLPNGIQSYASASYRGKWLFIAGRTNGLHGFNSDTNNFPPQLQNRMVYVVDPVHGIVASRSLTDPFSGLSQSQVDTLSVTSPQFYQSGSTLYITGGYGVDQATGLFSTKPVLTAIDIPGLMHWVGHPLTTETAAEHIRQLSHPIFRVTGGNMFQTGNNPTLLVFGQNFQGFYSPSSNGEYTQQVRRFDIIDNGRTLKIKIKEAEPELPNPNYRRRDLNVVPVMQSVEGRLKSGLVAFSGVFTLTGGAWTVPVNISNGGKSFMADPALPDTFKQGMNNYACPTIGLFSKKNKNMYTIFMGGISIGFFENGVFQTDPEIPFINQVTAIRLNKHGHFKQYLMNATYPLILSTQSNFGNPLLFGAGARFMMERDLPAYPNDVLKLDALKHGPIVLGYIVGGIQSTLPDTNSSSDSAASPYIFRVTLIPNPES